jgi:transposase
VPESPKPSDSDRGPTEIDWRKRAEDAEREREALRREREALRRERDQLQREQERLRHQIDHLKRQLEQARRAGFRQAAPFSKPLKPHPKRPGRKAGRAYGPKARRRSPSQVDERYDVPLPSQCPSCAGPVVETAVATQYQEELPIGRVVVRQFDLHVGRCEGCGRRVQGRHPLQTSDAIGAAAAQLGAYVIALVVVLNKQLGLSFGKISTLLQQLYGLTVTRSGLVHAVHRAARQAAPTYDALCARVRGSPMVSPDETGWKVEGQLQWLWAFATPDTTVYRIQPGRGFEEAAAVLGADFAGVLVRDGWAPYRQFTAAVHQTCLAHLLRRCRLIAADHPHTTFAIDVQAILQQALAVRDRYHAGVVSAHGLAIVRGQLITRLADRLGRSSRVLDVERFAAHLEREFTAIWSFLFDPTIDATNWRAEHAIRPAVVTRKVCGGNRSWAGADSQQILASVIRTASQREVNPHVVLASLLQVRTPHVVAELN